MYCVQVLMRLQISAEQVYYYVTEEAYFNFFIFYSLFAEWKACYENVSENPRADR
jgi:hypothetical protein